MVFSGNERNNVPMFFVMFSLMAAAPFGPSSAPSPHARTSSQLPEHGGMQAIALARFVVSQPAGSKATRKELITAFDETGCLNGLMYSVRRREVGVLEYIRAIGGSENL